jgi:Trp operon repressor
MYYNLFFILRLETLRRNARLENVESSEESEDEETLAASVAAITQGGNKVSTNNVNLKQGLCYKLLLKIKL